MQIQQDLLYASTHEWVRLEGDRAVVGLSDYAQHSLSDLVFITLPSEGDDVSCGKSFGDVESVKAVSDVISPVTGVVDAINDEVDISPELINKDPYGAWLIKVGGITEKSELMDAAAYEKFCEELEAGE